MDALGLCRILFYFPNEKYFHDTVLTFSVKLISYLKENKMYNDKCITHL